MWKGGFMKNYIINEDILCFTSDSDGKLLVIEKNRKINIVGTGLKFIKKSCLWYGHSYNLQRQFVIDKFNYYIKTPIIISEYKMLLFFPTSAPNSEKCVWISYNNVDRYAIEDNNTTKIYFKSGKVLNISASYTTIDSQITKCIKIEKYLSDMFKKVMKN